MQKQQKQQQISLYQKEIDKLNQTPNLNNPTQTAIKEIINMYIETMEGIGVDCSDLRQIYSGVIDENLLRQLYFSVFPSGKHSMLEKTLAKSLTWEDPYAGENKQCLGKSYQKFDFAVKYFSACMSLIANNYKPDNNIKLNILSKILFNDFITKPSLFPLSKNELGSILSKLKNIPRYIKSNGEKLDQYELIIRESNSRKPENSTGIIAVISETTQNGFSNQVFDCFKETILGTKNIFQYLSQSIEIMIRLQQRIIESQVIANGNWHGLTQDNREGRMKVYSEQIYLQKEVHSYVENLKICFSKFMTVFANREIYIYMDVSDETLNSINKLVINELIKKETEVFNSISNRASNRNIPQKDFHNGLKQTQKLQKDLINSFGLSLEKLICINKSLKEVISKVQNELKAYESIRKELQEKTNSQKQVDSPEKPPTEEFNGDTLSI